MKSGYIVESNNLDESNFPLKIHFTIWEARSDNSNPEY